MSFTSYGVNDAMTVKLWSKKLAVEANKATDIAPLFGESDDSIIQVKTETQKGTGDKITFALRMQLNGDGFTSSDVAEGNGEQLATNSDSVTIDELGHVVGVKSKNTIDAQRVPFDMREQAKSGLAEWFKLRKSVSFFNHVCGNLAANAVASGSGVKFTANNAVTAASSGRILRAKGLATDVLVAGDNTAIMDLSVIDKAVEIAKTGGSNGLVQIRPVDVEGMKVYVMYLHPTQITSLRTSTSSGQWLDIQKAAMAGMDSKKSAIFTGALGMYNGVILRESQQVTKGLTAANAAQANTRRAVLLGAQAATCAYGKAGGPTTYRWNEELYDHKRNLEVSAWSIWGMKKTTFNGADFASIVITTYAADAA